MNNWWLPKVILDQNYLVKSKKKGQRKSRKTHVRRSHEAKPYREKWGILQEQNNNKIIKVSTIKENNYKLSWQMKSETKLGANDNEGKNNVLSAKQSNKLHTAFSVAFSYLHQCKLKTGGKLLLFIFFQWIQQKGKELRDRPIGN